MKTDLVSVIMPVFNGERFIAQSIESVLAQTYPHWELIVVNDGSTDGTAGIVAQFTDPRIRCIQQDNKGLAGARNTGIDEARGKYLAFLDADDVWRPRFLERCVSVLQGTPNFAGVYTLNYHIDKDGAQLPKWGGQVVPAEALYARLLQGGFFPPCTVVIRTSIAREIGMFDTGLQGQGTEDWDLWLRITRHYPMQGIAEPLACYRVYPDSMSTSAGKMHACRMSVLARHFGPPEGDLAAWPVDKRCAFAYAYRAAALGYIAQREPDEGWRYLALALATAPSLAARLDTFYELVLGDQPRGYRGEASLVDVNANGAEMLRRMDALFAAAGPAVQALKGQAYGNAYLALAMLSDQAGDWRAARRYLRNALRAYPRLLRDRSVTRRLIKLSLGQRAANSLRRVRPEAVGHSAR